MESDTCTAEKTCYITSYDIYASEQRAQTGDQQCGMQDGDSDKRKFFCTVIRELI